MKKITTVLILLTSLQVMGNLNFECSSNESFKIEFAGEMFPQPVDITINGVEYAGTVDTQDEALFHLIPYGFLRFDEVNNNQYVINYNTGDHFAYIAQSCLLR